jgi:DamX protein
MSSSANSRSTYQSTQRLSESEPKSADGSIAISVTARIDYNLRFSKQAVLVVGDNTAQYSQLASQFLVSLSNGKPSAIQLDTQDNHINVAFVAASSKLNDIQMRCRLIEQLFVNTLFDPEQSLAVSVLRFAKQHGEAISIVIDHAHALSLQVKYELSQLVSLAKKSKLIINVVLFGLTEAAQQLATNKSLFKNKVVVIDAESGQVISLDDKKMTFEKSVSPLALWQKLTLASAIIIIAVALTWVYLLIAEDVNKQTFNTKEQTVLEGQTSRDLLLPISNDIPGNENTRAMQKKQKTTLVEQSTHASKSSDTVQATSEEIHHALMTNQLASPSKKIPAEAGDVLQALAAADNKVSVKVIDSLDSEVVIENLTAEINNSYYQTKSEEFEKGYVIQIAGFSDNRLAERFLSLYPEQNLHSYQKQLSGKDFTVITTKAFPNKAQAKSIIQSLPIQLIERKPWVKSISSVINEINTFKR